MTCAQWTYPRRGTTHGAALCLGLAHGAALCLGLAHGAALCLGLASAFATAACSGTLDAGWDEPRGQLPILVDQRNPIVLCNDGPYDNWQGEYAMLFASGGGPPLAGIAINTSPAGTNLDDNMAGWRQMTEAARQSGLTGIPDPRASHGPVLVRPSDGKIESTAPNHSEGADLIVTASKELSLPFRPLVVVTGGRLTDVADAYLVDPTLPDRVVVVSSLGTATADGGMMGIPDGEMDTWADIIVAQKFRYIQVSAFYDQKADLSDSLIAQLPANSFTDWIRSKKTKVYDDVLAADQVGVLTVALPSFVSSFTRAVQQGVDSDRNWPILRIDPSGPVWLVTKIDGALATARFGQFLLDPATFRRP